MSNQPVQQLSITEPRAITRLVYGNGIRAAVSEGERAELARALMWYEQKWHSQDQMAAQQAQAAAQQPPSPVDGPPPSAVEEHGVGSAEAVAKQEARRAARAETKGNGKAKTGAENDL